MTFLGTCTRLGHRILGSKSFSLRTVKALPSCILAISMSAKIGHLVSVILTGDLFFSRRIYELMLTMSVSKFNKDVLGVDLLKIQPASPLWYS